MNQHDQGSLRSSKCGTFEAPSAHFYSPEGICPRNWQGYLTICKRDYRTISVPACRPSREQKRFLRSMPVLDVPSPSQTLQSLLPASAGIICLRVWPSKT